MFDFSVILFTKQEEEVEAGVATIWIRPRDDSVFVTIVMVVVKMVTTADLEVTEMDTIDQLNVKEYSKAISKCQEMAITLPNEIIRRYLCF